MQVTSSRPRCERHPYVHVSSIGCSLCFGEQLAARDRCSPAFKGYALKKRGYGEGHNAVPKDDTVDLKAIGLR